MCRPVPLLTLVLTCLLSVATAARAQAPAPPPLEQGWEDVLLLDALRYLRLSPAQLQQVQPLIGVAEGRLTRLSQQQEPNFAALERLIGRHRQSLVKGRRTAAHEQQNALFLRRTLRGQRTEAIDQLTPYIAARLARILTDEQTARAHRLAHGDWPQRVPRSPALLAHESGFVLGDEERDQLRTYAVRQALGRRFPRQLVNNLPASGSGVVRFLLADQVLTLPQVGVSFRSGATLDLDIITGQPQAQAPADPARAAAIKAVRDEELRLRDRWEKLAELLVAEATPAELEVSLRPLARRLLCSPRIRIALEERLARREAPEALRGAGLEARQSRLAEHWEDVLLLDAVRYLLLTDDQLQRLLTLAEKAGERISTIRQEEERTRAALEQAVAHERRQLLEGRAVPPAEHEQVLHAMRAAREKRENAEEKIAAELAPELAGILSREQVLRAFLLARGEWPRDEARSPMLLDTEARFVIDANARRRWRDEAVRSLVARRFPKEWVAAANEQQGLFLSFDTLLVDSRIASRDLKLGWPAGRPLPFPPAVVEAARREHDRLTERWDGLATLLAEGGASAEELELALRPLVRRMFPSPRLRPVVAERLQRGAPLSPEELLPPASEGGDSTEPAP